MPSLSQIAGLSVKKSRQQGSARQRPASRIMTPFPEVQDTGAALAQSPVSRIMDDIRTPSHRQRRSSMLPRSQGANDLHLLLISRPSSTTRSVRSPAGDRASVCIFDNTPLRRRKISHAQALALSTRAPFAPPGSVAPGPTRSSTPPLSIFPQKHLTHLLWKPPDPPATMAKEADAMPPDPGQPTFQPSSSTTRPPPGFEMPSFLTTHEEPQEESLLDMDEMAAQPSTSRAADKSKATLYAFRDTKTIEAEEMPKPKDIKNDRATIRWMEYKLTSQDKLLAELKRALERHRIAININSEATQTNIQRMCDAEDHVADVVENLYLVADFLTEFKSTIFKVCDGKVSTAEARRQSAVLDVRMAMSSMFDKSKDQSLNLPPKSLDGGRPNVYNPRARSTDDSDQQPPRQQVRQRQGKKAPRRSSGPIRNKSPSPPPPDPSSSSSSAPPSRSPSRHRPSRHGSRRRSRRRSQRSHNSANPPPSPGFQLPGGYQLAVLDPELWLRHVRDGTVDSQPSAGGDKFRIKKDDIGQFNPHGADPDNEGVVGSGKDTIYIDVDCFLDRLETFREDPLTSVSVDKQLAQIFVTLLAGPASYWWTDQLTGTRRRELRALGISAMLEALRDRFPPDPAICTAKFTNLKLRLKDIAADDTALEKHMTTKLRLAKGMGILESSNSNWFGTVMTIWSTWPKEVRQYVRPPIRDETLDSYLQRIASARTLVVAAARDTYPWVKPATTATPASIEPSVRQDSSGWRPRDSRPDRHRRSGNKDFRSDHREFRDNRRDDRDRPRDDKRKDYGRDRDRNRDDQRRDQGRDRDRGDRGRDRYHRRDDKGRDRDRVHFANEGSDGDKSTGTAEDPGESDNSAEEDAEAESVFMVLDRHLTCHKCHENFKSTQQKLAHLRTCTPFKAVQMERIRSPSPTDLSQRTCGFCRTTTATRNLLFKHLKSCDDAKSGNIRPPPETEKLLQRAAQLSLEGNPADVAQDPGIQTPTFQFKEAPPELTKKIDDSLLSSYTHLRATATATPTSEPQEICIDPGTGRTYIDRKFLSSLEHTIESRKGQARGIGGSKKVKEWANFSFFLSGHDSAGVPTKMKITKSGWILDDLAPNLLLGNDFLAPYGGSIRYDDRIVDLNAIDFSMPFEIETRSKPCVRRVRTSREITLLPGQKAHVPVDFKPLPTDRSFAFESKHGAFVNSIIDAKTPRIAVAVNSSDGTLRIRKGTHVGYVKENVESGYFATSWASAWKTAGAAWIFGAAAAAMLPTAAASPTISSPTSLALGPSPLSLNNNLSVASDFHLDHLVQAVANGYSPTPAVAPASFEATPQRHSNTPPSDAVFNITQGVEFGNEIFATPEQATETPDLRIPEKQSTLGMRVDSDLPERVTSEGVHIYNADTTVAAQLERIVKTYPALWTNVGLIDVPKDKMMKVPLVEGWQNQKLNSRMYPLSKRDREVLDKVFGELHDQRRMEWATEPTPFAHPVFVVWRMVHGQPKARVVIDLRGLNKIAVPDNYPLPLQSDIINSLRGKQYITAVDATSFFYQFGVYPPHRDRFTLISPRGLERSTVALMGFRNSPAYTQRFMDQLLTPHAKYCRAFIDDIVIYSDNLEDHKKHLRKIFKLFISKNIAISPSKSFVGYPNVELLGFRVDGFGLSNTADRIAAYKQLNFPRNLKTLEQYIGSTGFLRHLIPYYAQLVEPLQKRKVALLAEGRKDGRLAIGNPNKRAAFCRNTSFTPTAAETESFNALQENICSEPTILIHFNPDRQLFLQVDGSLERGFGVMLFHVKHGYTWKEGDTIPANQVQPIMFLSKCLTSAETRYGPSELEVACLAWAVKRLHTIIHSANKTVIVLTDHSATKGIVEKTKMETTSTDRANKRLINASVYLSQFNLKVHHLAGKLNFVPDALSRLRAKTDTPQRPDGVPSLDDVWFAFAEAQMDNDSKAEFIQGYATDKRYSHIIEEIKRRPTTEDGGVLSRVGYPFVIVDDLLYNVGADGSRTLCVPYAMVKTVLEMVHDEKHHFGRERMLYDLRGLSIHGKTRAVKKYLQHCHSCNSCSNNNTLPHGDYQPIRPSDTLPMRTIGMDFIVGLPAVPAAGTAWQIQNHSHYNALLTVTDKATKRSLLIPGDDKYTAEEWGHTLMRHLLLSDWGVPYAIISDRDAKFTSSFWKGMWKALGTKLLMTAAYHPQGDGMAERKNQTVELAIRYHLFNHPGSDWVTILPHLQWSLNTAYSEPIGSSPHELLFGVKLPGPLDAVTKTADATAAEIPVLRDYLRRDAALAMDFAAAEAKRRYDAQHKAVEFQVGDQVFLKLHSGYHLPGRPTKKLSQQRSGPWTIKRKIGRLAYELDFLPSMGIHPVVSVAHLSAAPKGEDPFKRTAPPPGPVEDDQSSADEPGDTYEVEVVTAHKKMANGSLKYLIKWKGWDNHNNEWKTEWQLRNSPELIDEYWARKGDHDPDAVANRQRILPRTKPAKAALRRPATKKDGRAGEAVRGTRRSARLATD